MTGLRALRKEQTRQRILRTALALFEEKGYVATTIDEIAAQAETTRVTFYARFPGKRDVMRALLDELNELLERHTTEAHGSTAAKLIEAVRIGTADALRPWLATQATRWPEIKPYILVATQAAAVDPEIRNLYAGVVRGGHPRHGRRHDPREQARPRDPPLPRVPRDGDPGPDGPPLDARPVGARQRTRAGPAHRDVGHAARGTLAWRPRSSGAAAGSGSGGSGPPPRREPSSCASASAPAPPGSPSRYAGSPAQRQVADGLEGQPELLGPEVRLEPAAAAPRRRAAARPRRPCACSMALLHSGTRRTPSRRRERRHVAGGRRCRAAPGRGSRPETRRRSAGRVPASHSVLGTSPTADTTSSASRRVPSPSTTRCARARRRAAPAGSRRCVQPARHARPRRRRPTGTARAARQRRALGHEGDLAARGQAAGGDLHAERAAADDDDRRPAGEAVAQGERVVEAAQGELVGQVRTSRRAREPVAIDQAVVGQLGRRRRGARVGAPTSSPVARTPSSSRRPVRGAAAARGPTVVAAEQQRLRERRTAVRRRACSSPTIVSSPSNPAVTQRVGRGQPGDAVADDDDPPDRGGAHVEPQRGDRAHADGGAGARRARRSSISSTVEHQLAVVVEVHQLGRRLLAQAVALAAGAVEDDLFMPAPPPGRASSSMLRVMLLGTRTSAPTTSRSTRRARAAITAWRLEAGEPLSGAAVRAVAEREVVDRVALDQERVGVLVVARVAVARPEQDRDLRTRPGRGRRRSRRPSWRDDPRRGSAPRSGAPR